MCAAGHDESTGGHFVTCRVMEEQPVGTVIGNLNQSVRSVYLLEPETIQKLHFQLIFDDSAEDDANSFAVEAESGLLTVARRIDREHLCRSSSSRMPPSYRDDGACVILLQVRVFSVGDVDVRVVVDDVNDHDPSFASSAVEVSFPETATSGTLTQLPIATDPDAGENGRLSYNLISVSVNNVFDLLVLSGGDAGSGDVFLRLNTSVDREKQSVYSLTLVAVDSGIPRRTGTLSVGVVVTDANDHAPTFNATRYEFATVENRPPGSVIGRVQATDADDGDNARVTYSVTRVNGVDPRDGGGPLTVQADTGEIVVAGELDFERCAEYVLTVAAADRAAPQLRQFGYARVVVRLLDENDNAPEITTAVGGQPATAEVAENSATGTTVLELSVFDRDSGESGRVESCRLADSEDPNDEPPFTLRRHTSSYAGHVRYSLVTKVVLDRESRDRYSLLIACVDAGVRPLTGQTTLKVDVLDTNDNAPEFRNATSPIGVSLPEGNAVDDYVVRVEADDRDLGENGSVSYSVECFDEDKGVGSISAVLRVDNETGVVRAAMTLDRERRADYDCVVVAADGGRPSLSSSAHLRLTVVDVDDERAVFERRLYEFRVSENLPAGSVVGRVSSHDADGPPFNGVLYFLDTESDIIRSSTVSEHSQLL